MKSLVTIIGVLTIISTGHAARLSRAQLLCQQIIGGAFVTVNGRGFSIPIIDEYLLQRTDSLPLLEARSGGGIIGAIPSVKDYRWERSESFERNGHQVFTVFSESAFYSAAERPDLPFASFSFFLGESIADSKFEMRYSVRNPYLFKAAVMEIAKQVLNGGKNLHVSISSNDNHLNIEVSEIDRRSAQDFIQWLLTNFKKNVDPYLVGTGERKLAPRRGHGILE